MSTLAVPSAPAGVSQRRETSSRALVALPLICLPYAGAGASMYRGWKTQVRDTLRVVALQPAGREQRIRDPLVTSVDAAVSDLLPRALGELGAERCAAVFGHSMGAVLAYELTRALAAAGVQIRRLFVSGSPGPTTPRNAKATGLSDADFLSQVSKLAGYHHPALDDPSLRDLFLPILRADVAMHESYVESMPRPIDVPITAIRGEDDTLVSDREIDTWRLATTSLYEGVQLPGGHMYFAADAGPVLQLIMQRAASDGSSAN